MNLDELIEKEADKYSGVAAHDCCTIFYAGSNLLKPHVEFWKEECERLKKGLEQISNVNHIDTCSFLTTEGLYDCTCHVRKANIETQEHEQRVAKHRSDNG